MEGHEWDIEVIRGEWSLEGVPRPSPISGVTDFLPLGDKEGTVVRVRMHVVGGERLLGLNLLPGVAFVAGLPNLPIPELNEHGLETGYQFGVEKQSWELLTEDFLK